jgi:hypothetical protein
VGSHASHSCDYEEHRSQLPDILNLPVSYSKYKTSQHFFVRHAELYWASEEEYPVFVGCILNEMQ